MSIGEMGPAMTAYICILAAVAGAVFGSFINCAAWRIAHGENFLKGRSHCAECGHVLGIGDLIPVISYLALKGKCRYCGKKISPRYMLTELAMAAAFVLCLLRFDLSGQALRGMGFAVILLGLSLVDLAVRDRRRRPDQGRKDLLPRSVTVHHAVLQHHDLVRDAEDPLLVGDHDDG